MPVDWHTTHCGDEGAASRKSRRSRVVRDTGTAGLGTSGLPLRCMGTQRNSEGTCAEKDVGVILSDIDDFVDLDHEKCFQTIKSLICWLA